MRLSIGVILVTFIGLLLSLWFFSVGLGYPGKKRKLSTEAAHGKKLFQANNCIACHRVQGLGGFVGPDLTLVTKTKGEQYTKFYIEHGGGQMPFYGFDETEVENIYKYLEHLGEE